MQLNLDFKNPLKTICWILSILSWLLFLVTGWMGFSRLFNGKDHYIKTAKLYTDYNIWSFLVYDSKENDTREKYFPIQEPRAFLILLFVILMILGTIGFIIYLFKSVIKKDDHVFEGMMGTFARYHFIPLVCASALFLAGYTQEKSLAAFMGDLIKDIFFDSNKSDKYKNEFIVNLVFCIIGLLTLIFVKMQTKIENPFYVVYSIKDGLYSCLIALFTYCIFYSGFFIGLISKMKDAINLLDFFDWLNLLDTNGEITKYKKDCGIAFSICIGVINLCVSYILKDFILSLINLIIYLGLTIAFFDIKESKRKDERVTNAEGAIEIVITVLSAVVFAFLIYTKIIRKR